MAHEKHPDIGKKIWAGEFDEALRLARKAYLKNPGATLVMYASTLYSARKDEKCLSEIRERMPFLVSPLIEKIDRLSGEGDADALDVISTILLWWSLLKPAFNEDVQDDLRKNSLCAVKKGLELVKGNPSSQHPRHLLSLTYAWLLLIAEDPRQRKDGLWYLQTASRQARHVPDRNQRRRIYRKSAYLYYQYGHPFTAGWYAFQTLLT